MKRFLIVAIWLCGSGLCLAQDTKSEIQGLYQRIQGFTFNSGDPSFDIEGASTNGGGYAFVYQITEKFGLFQQMGFFGGVEQNGYKIRFITEVQGMRISKTKGPFDLYAKGGLGFTHFVFEGNFGNGGESHFAVVYGGGTEVKMKEGLYLVLEATRLTTSLPQLTVSPSRSGWDSSWLLSTGVAIHF